MIDGVGGLRGCPIALRSHAIDDDWRSAEASRLIPGHLVYIDRVSIASIIPHNRGIIRDRVISD